MVSKKSLRSCVNLSDRGETFECPICLETKNKGVVTNCGHVFCGACLAKLREPHVVQGIKHRFAYQTQCPICKAILIPELYLNTVFFKQKSPDFWINLC